VKSHLEQALRQRDDTISVLQVCKRTDLDGYCAPSKCKLRTFDAKLDQEGQA
jgi:hypothetical protein